MILVTILGLTWPNGSDCCSQHGAFLGESNPTLACFWGTVSQKTGLQIQVKRVLPHFLGGFEV